jgi:hypothetical protein
MPGAGVEADGALEEDWGRQFGGVDAVVRDVLPTADLTRLVFGFGTSVRERFGWRARS